MCNRVSHVVASLEAVTGSEFRGVFTSLKVL